MVIGLLADGVHTVSKSFQTIEQAAAKVAPISALVRHVLPGSPAVKDPPIETRSDDRALGDGYARRMAVILHRSDVEQIELPKVLVVSADLSSIVVEAKPVTGGERLSMMAPLAQDGRAVPPDSAAAERGQVRRGSRRQHHDQEPQS